MTGGAGGPVAPGPRNAGEVTAVIERRIAEGTLAAGSRLAPVRAAAVELGLAPNTVATAYRRLQRRGLVFSDGRRGTFVAGRPQVGRPADQSVPDGLVDLATGNPDPALLPDLGPALRLITTNHVAYGDDPIDGRLASLLAADMEPDMPAPVPGGLVAGRNLAVVGGALDGIERTLMAHLRPGDRVAIEDPAYTSVLDLIAAINLRTVPMAVDDSGVRPEELERALAGGAAAVIITPRAQNPTGAALDAERAGELRAVAARYVDTLMIADDHAGHIAGVTYHGAIPANAERWAVVRSVAKSLGPDLRVAGLAGDATTVNRVIGRQLLGTGWVSHILQQTVAQLLGSPATTEALAAAAEAYTVRRRRFIERLAEAGIAAHGRSGLNVWVPVLDEAEVVAGMQRRGYAIRSGARFRQNAAPAVRVSTARCDPGTVVEAAEALTAVIRGGGRARSV